MRILIDRNIRITLLKWLKRGYMETTEIPQLVTEQESMWIQLMKSIGEDDEVADEPLNPQQR